MLGTSILNPKHFTTSSSLFASWIPRNTPANESARVFAPILRCYLDVRFHALQRLPRTREGCPVKTDSQNLLISRVPPGETRKEAMTAPGKSANSRIRKLQVHADAKFHRAILLLFLKRFSRSPTGGSPTEGRGDIARYRISDFYRVHLAKIAL